MPVSRCSNVKIWNWYQKIMKSFAATSACASSVSCVEGLKGPPAFLSAAFRRFNPWLMLSYLSLWSMSWKSQHWLGYFKVPLRSAVRVNGVWAAGWCPGRRIWLIFNNQPLQGANHVPRNGLQGGEWAKDAFSSLSVECLCKGHWASPAIYLCLTNFTSWCYCAVFGIYARQLCHLCTRVTVSCLC